MRPRSGKLLDILNAIFVLIILEITLLFYMESLKKVSMNLLTFTFPANTNNKIKFLLWTNWLVTKVFVGYKFTSCKFKKDIVSRANNFMVNSSTRRSFILEIDNKKMQNQ